MRDLKRNQHNSPADSWESLRGLNMG
jgi:hypothetical protein